MEVPKQGFVIKFGQNQQKERVQLKIAAWALCKESNVASEMGHNLVSSLFEAAPVKELKSEELKIEYVTQDVQKTLSSPYKEYVASGEGQDMLPCLGKKEFKSEELKKENQTKNKQKIGVIPCSAEGLKRKPIVCCEDGREKVKAEYEERNNLDASVALKLESKSVFGGLKVKREVKFGGKDFCYEDIEEHGEEDEGGNNDIMYKCANAEHVQNIIAGRANISFYRFKRLMEDGHLKKEDLVMMRNVRVVQVPGRGEVVQFMQTKEKDFNKINIKELGLKAFEVRPHTWKIRVLAQTQLPSLIIEQVVMKNKRLKKRKNNKIRTFLSHRVADPASVFLYRRAANLLATLIQPDQAGTGEGQLVYHCKSCGVNTSSSKWRKNDRRRCIWHLAYAHSTDYQDLAAELNVAPGPRLDDLLFQAMAPGMIYHPKKPQ